MLSATAHGCHISSNSRRSDMVLVIFEYWKVVLQGMSMLSTFYYARSNVAKHKERLKAKVGCSTPACRPR